MAPRHGPHALLQRIKLMKHAVSWRHPTAQRRYKRDFDRCVQQKGTFKVGDYVLQDRIPLAPIASIAAEKPPNRHFIKFLLQASGLYKVLGIQCHTLTLDDYDIPKTPSISIMTMLVPRTKVTEIHT